MNNCNWLEIFAKKVFEKENLKDCYINDESEIILFTTGTDNNKCFILNNLIMPQMTLKGTDFEFVQMGFTNFDNNEIAISEVNFVNAEEIPI